MFFYNFKYEKKEKDPYPESDPATLKIVAGSGTKSIRIRNAGSLSGRMPKDMLTT